MLAPHQQILAGGDSRQAESRPQEGPSPGADEPQLERQFSAPVPERERPGRAPRRPARYFGFRRLTTALAERIEQRIDRIKRTLIEIGPMRPGSLTRRYKDPKRHA